MRGTKRSARLGVVRAEVYLDESYCNVNHVTGKTWLAGKTWLTADKIRCAGMGFSPKATIPTLIGLVELYRPPKRYQVTEIATKYDHFVFFTPPYHPTLQPIELIWGIVKGPLQGRLQNAVVKKVLQGLKECDDEWLKVYRHVQKNEDAYVKPDSFNC
ncbi:putative DDE superfamily endonuclease domain-containing protein [Phytophthora infestans]|uniref:Putative DDE superfamily endonuclease domain-containing protein n=1 Tax=Phytophthora infestans TaxID=4787 RepID=A0A8S9TR45_PHYIN|nr:putative DDE superfamily endonuclease domain-containing protein [Phytophthora infestans]